MNRRAFIAGSAAVALGASRAEAGAGAEQALDLRIAELRREMAAKRLGGSPVSIKWIAERLQKDLNDRDRRVAAFSVVRDVPYKLTAWTGDPNSLFEIDRGDCRHKSAALIALMRALKIDARPVQVPFDWADLPIPKSVLEPLAETRGIHDTVEVKVEGSLILVDPTWDPALAKAGFPVLTEWNGVQPTLPIAPHATTVVRRGDLKPGTDLYAHFGIRWPERERTLAFNRAFNAWTDIVRAEPKAAKDAG